MAASADEVIGYLINIVDKAFVTQTLIPSPTPRLNILLNYILANEVDLNQQYSQRKVEILKEIIRVILAVKS